MNKYKVLFAAGMNAAVYLVIHSVIRRKVRQFNRQLEDAYRDLQRTDIEEGDIVVDDMDASVTNMFKGFGDPSAVPPEITDKYGRPEHSAGAKEHREKIAAEELTWREATPEDLEELNPDDFEFLVGSPAVLRSIIAGTADSDFEGLMEEADKDADSP